MFGIFKTNGALRTQLKASHVRLDKNNETIMGLRRLLNEERRKYAELAKSSANIIAELQFDVNRLDPAKIVRVSPAVPRPLAANVIKMQSRTVSPTDAPINHGSSPNLGDMMLGGLMASSISESSSQPSGDSCSSSSSDSSSDSGGGGSD